MEIAAEHLRRVAVGDGTLAVAEVGDGERPLLLVHGFNGVKEDFGDWLEPLAGLGRRVVAPDLRGHGASHQPADEEAYSLVAFADELDALVAELGWDRYALLGHSMGGMIAQELALRDPTRIERLVLMDTHHGGIEGLDPEQVDVGMSILREQGRDALLALMEQVMPRALSPSEEAVRAARPGYREWADTKIDRCSPAMYAAMAPALVRRADRLAELAHLTVPTLVLVGEEDRDFVAAAHRMAEAIPAAELAVIPDAAHSPQFENPTAWWDAVGPFLA